MVGQGLGKMALVHNVSADRELGVRSSDPRFWSLILLPMRWQGSHFPPLLLLLSHKANYYKISLSLLCNGPQPN